MITRRNFFATTSLALAAAGCQSISKTGSCSKCGKVNFKLGMAGYSCNRLSTDDTLALLKRLDVNYLCIKNFDNVTYCHIFSSEKSIALFIFLPTDFVRKESKFFFIK